MLTKLFTISSGLLYFVNVIKISIAFLNPVLVILHSVTFLSGYNKKHFLKKVFAPYITSTTQLKTWIYE